MNERMQNLFDEKFKIDALPNSFRRALAEKTLQDLDSKEPSRISQAADQILSSKTHRAFPKGYVHPIMDRIVLALERKDHAIFDAVTKNLWGRIEDDATFFKSNEWSPDFWRWATKRLKTNDNPILANNLLMGFRYQPNIPPAVRELLPTLLSNHPFQASEYLAKLEEWPDSVWKSLPKMMQTKDHNTAVSAIELLSSRNHWPAEVWNEIPQLFTKHPHAIYRLISKVEKTPHRDKLVSYFFKALPDILTKLSKGKPGDRSFDDLLMRTQEVLYTENWPESARRLFANNPKAAEMFEPYIKHHGIDLALYRTAPQADLAKSEWASRSVAKEKKSLLPLLWQKSCDGIARWLPMLIN